MKTPRVSVIMSVYNGGNYLASAILSILNQTMSDFEFIIIDDGSTDNSRNTIESFSDQRIRLVSRENKGLVDSLNEAIGMAKSDLVARMDADDIAYPERLDKQVIFMENNPNIGLCGTWARAIDIKGFKINDLTYPPQEYQAIKSFALRHNPFIHSTVMFRKFLVKELGGYDHAFKYIEDYELWTRLLVTSEAINIPEILLDYRFLPSGITRSYNMKMRWRGIIVRFLALKRLYLSKN